MKVTGVRVEVEGVRVEVGEVQKERQMVAGAGMEVWMGVEAGEDVVEMVRERVVLRELAVAVEVMEVVEVMGGKGVGEGVEGVGAVVGEVVGEGVGERVGVEVGDGVEVELGVKCLLADRNRWDRS